VFSLSFATKNISVSRSPELVLSLTHRMFDSFKKLFTDS